MRFLHLGDTHIDSSVHGSTNPKTGVNRAWESHAACLRHLVDAAIEEQVDMVVDGGDQFNAGRPSQEAILLLTETLSPLAEAGIPYVAIGGNHERIGVSSAHRTATATVGRILRSRGAEVHIVERRPELVRLGNGAQIACMPWLSKSQVLSDLDAADLSPVEGDERVVDYAIDRLRSLTEEANNDGPLILASHVTVDDVRLDNLAKGHRRGSEIDIAHIFAEPVLPRAEIEALPYTYAALSHIHTPQRMGAKCFYPGSVDRFTFTDALDKRKGGNLVTLDDTDGSIKEFRHIDTPARVLREIDLDTPEAEGNLAALDKDMLVKVVLPVGEQRIPPEVRQAITDAGAYLVDTKKTPPPRPKTDATVLPEKVTTEQALRTYVRTKGADGLDVEELVSVAAQLEGAA